MTVLANTTSSTNHMQSIVWYTQRDDIIRVSMVAIQGTIRHQIDEYRYNTQNIYPWP